MIKARGLTKRYKRNLAVDHIDLDVERGEVFGFLGPNGAGKTTTVRMLACLIAPTEGEAWIGSWRVGHDDDRIRGQIGILTESPGLYDRFSAKFNLDFYARLYGVPETGRPAQVEKYLRLLELWERRDEPVGTFSKGMKQKMAIARAIVHEPGVLFLDEPTSGLDPEAARTVRDFIAGLRAEGRTIFICTHNLDEADRLCDRVAIMRRSIVATGSPAELRRRLHGAKTVVTLAAPRDDVRARVLSAVRRLPFAGEAEAQGDELLVPVADPATQNPVLVRAVVEAGGEVLYVSELKVSLEEIYLGLMGQGSGAAP
jgi:ABC-2 type transport system ATP-binding protein